MQSSPCWFPNNFPAWTKCNNCFRPRGPVAHGGRPDSQEAQAYRVLASSDPTASDEAY